MTGKKITGDDIGIDEKRRERMQEHGTSEAYEKSGAAMRTALAASRRGEDKLKEGCQEEADSNFLEAIAWYNLVIELQSASPDQFRCSDRAMMYSNRAYEKLRLGRYEEAIADCTTGIELHPISCSLYSIRGKANTKLGRHEEAAADLQKASELEILSEIPL